MTLKMRRSFPIFYCFKSVTGLYTLIDNSCTSVFQFVVTFVPKFNIYNL